MGIGVFGRNRNALGAVAAWACLMSSVEAALLGSDGLLWFKAAHAGEGIVPLADDVFLDYEYRAPRGQGAYD
jgi:hypothetical protein